MRAVSPLLPRFSGKWNAFTLGELEKRGAIELLRGKVISQKDIDRLPGNYPIYSSSVQLKGLFGSYSDYMFDEELITWSVDGGGNFFYRPRHRFSVTNVCGYLRIRTSDIDYRYLAYYLQHLHSRKTFDYTLKAHPSVIRSAYTVALPPLPEQRAIVQVLSDVDKLLEALDRLIAKKQAIKQTIIQQLLTGDVRLPGFDGEWEAKRLSDLGFFAKGRGIKRGDVSKEGLPCVRYGELYTEYDNYILHATSRISPTLARTALPIKEGALLFAGSGETAEDIGRCACLLYTSPSPRDRTRSRMPSSA